MAYTHTGCQALERRTIDWPGIIRGAAENPQKNSEHIELSKALLPSQRQWKSTKDILPQHWPLSCSSSIAWQEKWSNWCWKVRGHYEGEGEECVSAQLRNSARHWSSIHQSLARWIGAWSNLSPLLWSPRSQVPLQCVPQVSHRKASCCSGEGIFLISSDTDVQFSCFLTCYWGVQGQLDVSSLKCGNFSYGLATAFFLSGSKLIRQCGSKKFYQGFKHSITSMRCHISLPSIGLQQALLLKLRPINCCSLSRVWFSSAKWSLQIQDWWQTWWRCFHFHCGLV